MNCNDSLWDSCQWHWKYASSYIYLGTDWLRIVEQAKVLSSHIYWTDNKWDPFTESVDPNFKHIFCTRVKLH